MFKVLRREGIFGFVDILVELLTITVYKVWQIEFDFHCCSLSVKE